MSSLPPPSPESQPDDFRTSGFGTRPGRRELPPISRQSWETLSLLGQGLDPSTATPITIPQVAERWAQMLRREVAPGESAVVLKDARNIWVELHSASGECLSASTLEVPLAICSRVRGIGDSLQMRCWSRERQLFWQPQFNFPTFDPAKGAVATEIHADYGGIDGFVLQMKRLATSEVPPDSLLGAGAEYVIRISQFPGDQRMQASCYSPFQHVGDQVAAIAQLCAAQLGVPTNTSWPTPLTTTAPTGVWHRFQLGPLEVGVGAVEFLSHVRQRYDPDSATLRITQRMRVPATGIGFSLCDAQGTLGTEWMAAAHRLVSSDPECHAMPGTVKHTGKLILGEYFVHSGYGLLSALHRLNAALPPTSA